MNQEEYVWTVTLDKNVTCAAWCPVNADDGGEDDNMIHKLQIRNAFFTSKKNDDDSLHIITLETSGLKDEPIKCPLVMLRGNSQPQVPVGQCFNREVKFSLTEGTGPVVLVGNHILDIGNEKYNSEENDDMLYGEASEGEETDVEEQEDEQEEEEEEVDEEMTEEEEDSPVKPKKPLRKTLPNGVKNGKKRKAVEDHEDEESETSPKESKRKVAKKQKVIESNNGAKNKSKKSNK